MHIRHYCRIDRLIHTSGQPQPAEFALIRQAGAETVVNLAQFEHPDALSNEAELVAAQGMNYIQIPVAWQAPQPQQYRLFQAIMQTHRDRPIWLHCALNRRVACFVYLYRTRCLGVPEPVAQRDLASIWQPDEVWTRFMESIKREDERMPAMSCARSYAPPSGPEAKPTP
ncbi:MAG: protein tyrosine phosphatase family protein [Cellvibrionales bacterium]|nr:protein tyrosine phosphatase family protein [Cellvibrionales bacterium]